MSLDILYVAWNRLEFTKFSLRMLLENTAWDRVSKLILYDDNSQDGTEQLLYETSLETPVPCEFWQGELNSVPGVMNLYVSRSEADWFAKIDNDIVVPPGWLEAMQEVIDGNPTVELLGMEAGRGLPVTPEWDGIYRFEPGSHTGGVGLLRVDAFRRRVRMKEGDGRFGFTEWQHEYRPVRGWINPDLPVVSLDRVPFEPWASLSERYVEKEWQRPWGKYHEQADYWEWWPK
jgi:glycosyltransferase involved in cell wall biosynthesis